MNIIVKIINKVKTLFRKQATPTNQAIITPTPETALEQTVKVPWRKRNHDKYINTRRIHISNNKEQLKEYNRQWHQDNAESVAKRKHEWYLSHKNEAKGDRNETIL